jgi:hypothetical protein
MNNLNLKECLALDDEYVQHARRVEEAELHTQTPIRRIWAHAGGLLIPLIVGAVILSTFIVGSYRYLPQLPSPSLGTNSGG